MLSYLPLPRRSRGRRTPNYDSPPKLRVLLTNGRLPISLELARQLSWTGHRVYCIDSLQHPVCKFSSAVYRSRQVPTPHTDTTGYCEAVRKVISDWHIDLIVPLHDEVFFLAACPYSEVIDKLLAPPLDLLLRLNHKWEFSNLMLHLGLAVPESHLCSSLDDVEALDRTNTWLLKPVYSHAPASTTEKNCVHIFRPGDSRPDTLIIDVNNQYVAQVWMKGARFRSYNLVRKGRLQAQCIYPASDSHESLCTPSLPLPSLYSHAGIRRYLERFAAAFPNLTTQLTFEFVETDPTEADSTSLLLALECSLCDMTGIQLWRDSPFLARALTNTLTITAPDCPDFTSPPHHRLRDNSLAIPRSSHQKFPSLPNMAMTTHPSGSKHKKFPSNLAAGNQGVGFKVRDILPSLVRPFLPSNHAKMNHEKNIDMLRWFHRDSSLDQSDVQSERGDYEKQALKATENRKDSTVSAINVKPSKEDM